MIHELQRILLEDQPAIFLTHINRWWAYTEALKDFYALYYGHVGLYWEYYLTE